MATDDDDDDDDDDADDDDWYGHTYMWRMSMRGTLAGYELS